MLCVLFIGRQRNQLRARFLEFTTVGLEKWVQLVTEIVKFFLATMLLQYLLFGGLAWVSRMHFATAVVKRALSNKCDLICKRIVPCKQVHKMLAEFKLIPGLNNLFDKLI